MAKLKDILNESFSLVGGVVSIPAIGGGTHTALSETDDWFDKVTVNRNMKELTNLSKSFGKIAKESNSLQQRMGGLYEDMGHVLGRYFELEGGDEDHEAGHEEEPQADQEDAMIKKGLKNIKGADIKEGDYDVFFQAAMKKFGISSPDELEDDKKKHFLIMWTKITKQIMKQINK